jgi:PAS domain S-box-containing protein
MNGARKVRVIGDDVQRFAVSIGEELSEFIESVPDAMILSDHYGRIVLVNSNTERMFGYSRDELLGKEIEILVPDRFKRHCRRHRIAYYANPNIRPMGVGEDLWACGRDGTEFAVEISLSPVKIKGRSFIWSAVRKISDRQRAFDLLREAIKHRLIDLRGLISMCAWCKRICDEDGSWQQLEQYIQSRSRAKFTHGICHDCLLKLNPASHKHH